MNRPTQFKPGQSGNPKGRPKEEWTMRALIQEALEESGKDKVAYKRAVARKLIKLAIEGEIVAIKEINQRIDGMPPQTLDAKVEGTYNVNIDGLIGLSQTSAETTDSDSGTTQPED